MIQTETVVVHLKILSRLMDWVQPDASIDQPSVVKKQYVLKHSVTLIPVRPIKTVVLEDIIILLSVFKTLQAWVSAMFSLYRRASSSTQTIPKFSDLE